MKRLYVSSLKGTRNTNEDTHETILNLDGNLGNVNFFCLFDGHGGHEVSHFLKRNLPKFFVNDVIKYPINKKYVNKVYDHIQNALKSQPFAQHAGCTGLVGMYYDVSGTKYLGVINNGDSRCVLCRDNFAVPLTRDHKPAWPEEYHRIAQLGGKIEHDGYDYRIKDLSVSRAFGDLDAIPYVTHNPDIFRYKIDSTSDKFFIMACDGLWDVLDNSTVTNYILMRCYDKTLKTRINKSVNIANELAKFAIEKGSTDNVTVIIYFFD